MKTFCLFVLTVASQSSIAAISINGVAVINAKDSYGISNVPVGSLGLLIVDVGGDGIAGVPSNFSGPLTFPVRGALNSLDTTTAGIDVGTTFGGDLVIARMTSSTTGTSGLFTISLSNLDVTGMESRQFAVVWFDGLTSSNVGGAPFGSQFGLVHASNWVMPSTDTGLSYAFGSTYAVPNMAATSFPSGYYYTASGGGNPAANVFIIPESSTMLLWVPSIAFLLRRKHQ